MGEGVHRGRQVPLLAVWEPEAGGGVLLCRNGVYLYV